MGHEVVVAAGKGATAPTSLAPGFRFHPTDEELVRYYLRRKACGKPFRFEAVIEIDVYKSEPWELAEYSSLKTRDQEWYFFSPVDRKYGNGSRLNRATGKGYWKATGKDRPVRHKNQAIGMKKTLVFHSGRAPDGKRTNWVMHEYRLCDMELERAGVTQDAFVLCRIFQKSGLGPPNGDRYAPFVEEEWDDDAVLVVPGGDADDDLPNGDEVRVECTDLGQNVFGHVVFYVGAHVEIFCKDLNCYLEFLMKYYYNELHIEYFDKSSELLNVVDKEKIFGVYYRSSHQVDDSEQTSSNNYDLDPTPLIMAPPQIENPVDSQSLTFLCKREKSEDPRELSLSQSKRSKHNDPNSSNANGSEDSTTMTQDPSAMMMTTNFPLGPFEFPLLEPVERQESRSVINPLDSSNLEKSVPPGYLKFISNLENEILNVSMDRETLKIEVMRAQAMINILQSQVESLTKDNEDLRRCLPRRG